MLRVGADGGANCVRRLNGRSEAKPDSKDFLVGVAKNILFVKHF